MERMERVSCVIDGDTVDIGGCGAFAAERIRLLGIDAPELSRGGQPTECYGDEARDALRSLIDRRDVTIQFDRGCVDPFSRTLAWLLLPEVDGDLNVSVWMVERGFARLYLERDDFDDLLYASELRAAEMTARSTRVGLWGACGP
jgi:micrococcal nuclease